MSISKYKETAIGLIPEDWEVKKLGEIGAFSKGKGILKNDVVESGFPCVRYGEIYTTHNYIIKDFKSYINETIANESQEIIKGDILFAGSGETIEDIGKCVAYMGEEKAYAGGDIIIFKPHTDFSETISYALETDIARRQKRFMGQGNSIVHLYSSDLKKLKLPIPPLLEQQKIAEILSEFDQAINTTKQIVAELKVRNKGLAQQLLSGKIRVNGFEKNIKDQFFVIEKFLNEVSKKNSKLEVKRILSVTNNRGFINQSEQFGREVASADLTNYKIVKRNQFAYNPSRINVGSVDLLKTFDEGVLSPMYVVFETNNKKLLPNFFHHHLKTYWFKGHIPMFIQGSVRDSLSFNGLCSMRFFIPSLKEQEAITNILDKATEELKQCQEKIQYLQLQKKGLMQQLLTGKVRVKI